MHICFGYYPCLHVTILCFQFASFVTDKTSTHGGRWYSSLSSCPWIQAILFLFFFTIQILLFVIFVEKIFFNEKVDIKTSLEYVNNWDYHYPQITLCSSAMYNKTVLKRKLLIQRRWEFFLILARLIAIMHLYEML